MKTMRKNISLATRGPIWFVLSHMFVDTEHQESDYRSFAEKILESKFTPLEIEYILWNEVFPIAGRSFSSAVGVWPSFNENWLQTKIVNFVAGIEKGYWENGFITVSRAEEIIKNEWQNVCKYLPSEYSDENKIPNK